MSDEQHPSGEIIAFEYSVDGGDGGPADGVQKLQPGAWSAEIAARRGDGRQSLRRTGALPRVRRHRQHRAAGHGPGLRCVPGDGAEPAGAAARAHASGVGLLAPEAVFRHRGPADRRGAMV